MINRMNDKWTHKSKEEKNIEILWNCEFENLDFNVFPFFASVVNNSKTSMFIVVYSRISYLRLY